MKKLLTWLAVMLGIVCVALAVYYWLTPAGSLATFMPGYEAGSAHIHLKHGIAALLLGLALFAYAWFTSAPKKNYDSTRTVNPPTSTQ